MWHLTHLSFENYRTFERPESIELRPLTVLIGRNSSGKSAIARLPLLLRRGLSDKADSPLELEFDGHDFGGSFLDFVSGRVPTRAVTLGVTASDGAQEISLEASIGYWTEFQLQAIREFRLRSLSTSVDWTLLPDSDPRVPFAPYLSNLGDDEPIAGQVRFLGFHPIAFSHSIVESMVRGTPSLIERDISSLRQAFDELSYLGPFREAPQREERIPQGIELDIGLRGERAARVLAHDWLRQGSRVLKGVGDWYKNNLGGWHLDLERDGNRFSVVLRSPQDPTVAINLRDAGVGLSQVLPLVVQHEMNQISGRGSLNIVEQPELHLHPGAHGALADLYVEAVLNSSHRFIIETHSENFILRIRRRIAEKEFSPDDVALYWVNDDLNASPRIQRIKIDEMGGIDFWPSGVFSEDLAEVQAIRRAQKDRAP